MEFLGKPMPEQKWRKKRWTFLFDMVAAWFFRSAKMKESPEKNGFEIFVVAHTKDERCKDIIWKNDDFRNGMTTNVPMHAWKLSFTHTRTPPQTLIPTLNALAATARALSQKVMRRRDEVEHVEFTFQLSYLLSSSPSWLNFNLIQRARNKKSCHILWKWIYFHSDSLKNGFTVCQAKV